MGQGNFDSGDEDYEDIVQRRVSPQDVLAAQRGANAAAAQKAAGASDVPEAVQPKSAVEELRVEGPKSGDTPEDFWARQNEAVARGVLPTARPADANEAGRQQREAETGLRQKQAELDAETRARQQQARAREAEAAAQARADAAQARADAAAKAKAARGAVQNFKRAGGLTEDDEAGNEVPKMQAHPYPQQGPTPTGEPLQTPDVPAFTPGPTGEPPVQDKAGNWVVPHRNKYGGVDAMPVERSPHFHEDQTTGERYYTHKGQKIPLGANANLVERNKLKATQVELERDNMQERIDLGDARLRAAEAKEGMKPFAAQVKTAETQIANLEKTLAVAKGKGRELVEKRLAEARAVLADPNYLAAKAKLDAAEAEIGTRQKSILDRREQALEVVRNLDKLKAARNLPPGTVLRPAKAEELFPPEALTTDAGGRRSVSRDAVEAQVAALVAQGRGPEMQGPPAPGARVPEKVPTSHIAGYGAYLEQLRASGIEAVGGKPISQEIEQANEQQKKLRAMGIIAEKVSESGAVSMAKFSALPDAERAAFLQGLPAAQRAPFAKTLATFRAMAVMEAVGLQNADQAFAMLSPEQKALVKEQIGREGMQQLGQLAQMRAQRESDQARVEGKAAAYEASGIGGKVWANAVALYGGATKGLGALLTAPPRIYGMLFQNGAIKDRAGIQWADNVDAILDETYSGGKSTGIADTAGNLIGSTLSFLIPTGLVGQGLRAGGVGAKAVKAATVTTTALAGAAINGAGSVAESTALGLTDDETWKRFLIAAPLGVSEIAGIPRGMQRMVDGLIKFDRRTNGSFKGLLVGMGREYRRQIPEEMLQEGGNALAVGLGDMALGIRTRVDERTGERRVPTVSDVIGDTFESALHGAAGALIFGTVFAANAHEKDRARLRDYARALETDGGYAVMHDLLGELRGQMNTARAEGREDEVHALKDRIEQAQFALGEAAKKVTKIEPTAREAMARTIAPEFDLAGADRQLDGNETLRFAAVEIGRALRGAYPGAAASAQGGAQAALDQMLGAHVVATDLTGVLNGGMIEEGKAAALEQLGLLETEQQADGSTVMRVTDDALALFPPALRDAVANDTTGKYNFKVTAGTPGQLVNNLVKSGEDRLAGEARAKNAQAGPASSPGSAASPATGGTTPAAGGESRVASGESAPQFRVQLKVELPGGSVRTQPVTVGAANAAEAVQIAVAQARGSAPQGAKISVAGAPVAVAGKAEGRGQNAEGESRGGVTGEERSGAGEAQDEKIDPSGGDTPTPATRPADGAMKSEEVDRNAEGGAGESPGRVTASPASPVKVEAPSEATSEATTPAAGANGVSPEKESEIRNRILAAVNKVQRALGVTGVKTITPSQRGGSGLAMNTRGELLVDFAAVAKQLQAIPRKNQQAWIEAAAWEEVIGHRGLLELERLGEFDPAEFWHALTEREQAEVRRRYTGFDAQAEGIAKEFPDHGADWARGHEAARYFLQQVLTGRSAEDTFKSKTILDLIDRLVRWIKRSYGSAGPVGEVEAKFRKFLDAAKARAAAAETTVEADGTPLPGAEEFSQEAETTAGQPTRSFRLGGNDGGFSEDPLIAVLSESRILSKTAARKKWGAEKFAANAGLWDDAPRLSNPAHNKIYGPNGLTPDEAAQHLVDAGLLPQGATETEMWRAVGRASEAAERQRRRQAAQGREVKDLERKERDFDRDAGRKDKGDARIEAGDLKVGDAVVVDGTTLRVTGVDAETGDVTLEDGDTYGVQLVEDGEVIYGRVKKAKSGKPDGPALEAAPAVGMKLREVGADFPVDDEAPRLVGAAKNTAEFVQQAAAEFQRWPRQTRAADGSKVLLKNPEAGSFAKRLRHLLFDNDLNRISAEKGRWMAAIPQTVEGAALRLHDDATGNAIYVRAYRGGARHMVVVRPDGEVETQRPFAGKLITQFPESPNGRQQHLTIDWVREGSGGKPALQPSPASAPQPSSEGAGPGQSRSENVGENTGEGAERQPAAETVKLGNAKITRGPQIIALNAATAYHGTPHEVDRFSLDKIGTGEGSQAYGWGLYFAQNPKVAEEYRKGLTERDFIRKVQEVYGEFDSPAEAVEALADVNLSDGQRALLGVLEAEGWWGFDYPHQAVRAALTEPENFDPSPEFREAVAKFGNTYTVTLDVEPDELLDWDKPLSEQEEKVREALRKLGVFKPGVETVDARILGNVQLPERTGGEAFRELARRFNSEARPGHSEEKSPKQASEALRNAGLAGIRYLDQGSRDFRILSPGESTSGKWVVGPRMGERSQQRYFTDENEARAYFKANSTANFVMFDDSKIRVTHRNGQPVELAAALGAAEADPRQGAFDFGKDDTRANRKQPLLGFSGRAEIRGTSGLFAPQVEPRKLAGLFAEAAESPVAIDISGGLDVAGHPGLFGGGLGVSRADMPQLPREYRARFLAWLEKRGIGHTDKTVNALRLKATQRELDAVRIGRVLRSERELSRGFVSADGYVIDGHHRWAAQIAEGFTTGRMGMDVTEIGLPIRGALAAMRAFNAEHGIVPKPIEGEMSPVLGASRVRDTGTMDLFSTPAVQTAATAYVKAAAKSNVVSKKDFVFKAKADGLREVAEDLFSFAVKSPPALTKKGGGGKSGKPDDAGTDQQNAGGQSAGGQAAAAGSGGAAAGDAGSGTAGLGGRGDSGAAGGAGDGRGPDAGRGELREDTPLPEDPDARNFVIADGMTVAPRGNAAKYAANLAAIRTLQRIEGEGRRHATAATAEETAESDADMVLGAARVGEDERIAHTALRRADGKIFEGDGTHWDLYDEAFGGDPDYENGTWSLPAGTLGGFTTNRGRFLDREEAYALAKKYLPGLRSGSDEDYEESKPWLETSQLTEAEDNAAAKRYRERPALGASEVVDSGRAETRVNDERRMANDELQPAKSVAELVQENMGLAVTIANAYRNIPGHDWDNVLGEARKALVKAARGFDADRGGAPFGAYAGTAIRNTLNNLFNKNARTAAREVASADETPEGTYGMMEETLSAKNRMVDEGAQARVSGGIEGRETSAELAEAMATLPERVRTVLTLHGEGAGLREIGTAIGLSHEMARRILANGVAALQVKLRDKGFTGVDADGILYAAEAQTDEETARMEIEEETERIANPSETPEEKPAEGLRELLARGFAGRIDWLDMMVPGGKNLLTDAHIKNSQIERALRIFRERIQEDVKRSFGYPSWWRATANVKRLARFTAKLLPTAARLNATAQRADGSFVFGDFWMRAGEIGVKLDGDGKPAAEQKKQMGLNGVPVTLREGVFIQGRHGEKLRVGRLVDEKINGRRRVFWQMERFMPADLQARIHEEFHREFPEAAHWLDSWINPSLRDSRVSVGGVDMPDFNRFSVAEAFRESPFGPMAEIPGYTPDVVRGRSLAGFMGGVLQNLLSRTATAKAREHKSGEARERGEVQDLFTAFNVRAAEAHAETQRRQLAEALLEKALKDIPATGMPSGYAAWNAETVNQLLQAYHVTRGLNPEEFQTLKTMIKAQQRGGGEEAQMELIPADAARMEQLAGRIAAEALQHQGKMIPLAVLAELRRPMANQYVENTALRIFGTLISNLTGAYLVGPSTLMTNVLSNEMFKVMHTARRFAEAMLGGAGLVGSRELKDQAKLRLYETGYMLRGMIADRWLPQMLHKTLAANEHDPGRRGREQTLLNELVPDELFAGDHRWLLATNVAEADKTGLELLKEANISGALLKWSRYDRVDPTAKKQIAAAAYMAHASLALDKARAAGEKVGDAAAWKKDWVLNRAPQEVHREAYYTAQLVALDYANLPWILDPSAQWKLGGKDITAEANLVRRGLVPYMSWTYNLARQGKRLTLDSLRDVLPGNVQLGGLDVTRGATRTPQERREAMANLCMMAMLFVLGRLMFGDDDEDGLPVLGRSFDDLGNKLEGGFNTAGRVNITDNAYGRILAAAARMLGVFDEDDTYWLKVRNYPYLPSILAMTSMTGGGGNITGKDMQANVGEVVVDVITEGAIQKLIRGAMDSKGRHDQGKSFSFIAGEVVTDLLSARLLPPQILRAINNQVDPMMRRNRPSKALGSDPGFIEAVQQKIPGAARNQPPSGRVVVGAPGSPKTLAAESELRAQPDVPESAMRTFVNDKGELRTAYVRPGAIYRKPRWLEALRQTGQNVKVLKGSEYLKELGGGE